MGLKDLVDNSDDNKEVEQQTNYTEQQGQLVRVKLFDVLSGLIKDWRCSCGRNQNTPYHMEEIQCEGCGATLEDDKTGRGWINTPKFLEGVSADNHEVLSEYAEWRNQQGYTEDMISGPVEDHNDGSETVEDRKQAALDNW